MQNNIIVRPIEPQDNGQIEAIIRHVLVEFGANRAGFAFADAELSDMYTAYHREDSEYLIVWDALSNTVLGGVGIGPLAGADASICELKKMYLHKAARGLGLSVTLLAQVLALAKLKGYQQCYLETLVSMTRANHLYTQFGFTPLSGPMGNTGHFGCDTWYLKDLQE